MEGRAGRVEERRGLDHQHMPGAAVEQGWVKTSSCSVPNLLLGGNHGTPCTSPGQLYCPVTTVRYLTKKPEMSRKNVKKWGGLRHIVLSAILERRMLYDTVLKFMISMLFVKMFIWIFKPHNPS